MNLLKNLDEFIFGGSVEVFSRPCSSNQVHRGVRIFYKGFLWKREVRRENFFVPPLHAGCDCMEDEKRHAEFVKNLIGTHTITPHISFTQKTYKGSAVEFKEENASWGHL